MGEGGDRGFLFRALGLALLLMVGWRLASHGGILAGGDQILSNREAMAGLAPWVLLGLFFLRGPLPARKSAARVVGFQFLNLGFLVGAVVYGLAAIPLELPAPEAGKEHAPAESDWLARDRVREINLQMEELERTSGESLPSSDNPVETRRQETRRQQLLEQMEKLRTERSRLGEELNRRGRVLEESQEKERESRKQRLARAQTGAGGAAVIFVLMGLHGLLAGFLFRGGGPAPGGFPVVSSSAGKVESSVPGALRPKRSLN
ncbi:MAG: hypothetical protein EBZ44_01305 [Verrucomicrobia bacterium]|nr:hypothetical protein [Verrucomicrobiota bacterium]